MPTYHTLDQGQRRALLEACQRRLWGDDPDAFRDLLDDRELSQPMIRLDDEQRLPVLPDLHAKAQAFVQSYNEREFPVRFRDDLETIEAGFRGPAAPDGGTSSSGGDPPNPVHTCVKWEWVDGVLVASYNYVIVPDEDEEVPPPAPASGTLRPAARRTTIAELTDYNLFEDEEFDGLVPEDGSLKGVFQLLIGCRMRFPLPELHGS